MTNADFHKKILETIWDIIEEAQDEVEDTGGLTADEGCPAGPLTEEQEGFVRHVAEKLSDIRTDIAGAINEAETAEEKGKQQKKIPAPGAAMVPPKAGPEVHIHMMRTQPFPIGDACSREKELAELKKAIKAISATQKECSCHCTLDVDISW